MIDATDNPEGQQSKPLKEWLPFIETLQEYNPTKFRLDAIAGLTVALVALPQAMAYALIAGVEPKFGIYALIVGSIIGSLFGSSRFLHTGPVNASSIVVAATMIHYVGNSNYMAMVFMLALMTGLFQLLSGVLKLGNLTQFISRSVLVGFMTGAALLIIINQISNFMGLPQISGAVIVKLSAVLTNFEQVDQTAIAIGLGTVLVTLLLSWLSPKSSSGVAYIPSHLLGILLAAAAVAAFDLTDKGIRVVGVMPAGLPPLSVPDFNPETVNLLLSGALALSIISISEAVASAKSVASLAGEKIDANKELIGQGLAKIGVAFYSGMPVSGSFTRTTLSFRAGAQTRFAGVYSGIIIAVILLVFSPITRFIPLAALAGTIMLLATQMINWRHIGITFKTTKSDAAVMVATFASTLLFHLDTAIFIGIGLSLILFLRKAVHPRLIEFEYDASNGFQEIRSEKKRILPEIAIVHLEGDIFFGAAEFMENEIGKVAKRKGLKVLILRMKGASCLDATSIISLMEFIENMRKRDKLVIISGVTGEVEQIFRRSGIGKVVGEGNIFFSDVTVLRSTKKALDRAKEFVAVEGDDEYKVSLYYDKPERARVGSKA